MRLPDLPVPEVTEGTVLVKAQAAALNPVDNALAAGTMAQMIPRQYPLVLGRDAAGTVEAIGPGGTSVAAGGAVIGHMLLTRRSAWARWDITRCPLPRSRPSRPGGTSPPPRPCAARNTIRPVTCGSCGRQAACMYSLIRPLRTGFRRIRSISGRSWRTGERRIRHRGRAGRCPGAAGRRCSEPGIRSRWRADAVRRGSGHGRGAQRTRGISCASAANHIRSAGSYRIRPACRRRTAFSCRSTSSSAFLSRSLRASRTARLSTRRTSR